MGELSDILLIIIALLLGVIASSCFFTMINTAKLYGFVKGVAEGYLAGRKDRK